MEGLRANPRRNEVDPDALRWTPSTTLNAVLSEEEREAEMDVGLLFKQETLVICLLMPTVVVIVCLFDWALIETINREKHANCQHATNAV